MREIKTKHSQERILEDILIILRGLVENITDKYPHMCKYYSYLDVIEEHLEGFRKCVK